MTILLVTGLIIGFSFNTTLPDAVLGILMLIAFGYAFSWVFAFLGLVVSSPESANSVGFIAVFPLTFVSSAFVPTNTFPLVLRDFAKVNPFTIVVNALRHLWEPSAGVPTSGSNVWESFVWIAVILAIFAPLGVARYRRATGA
jgi:ABC-type multidrug transport system permease subunit